MFILASPRLPRIMRNATMLYYSMAYRLLCIAAGSLGQNGSGLIIWFSIPDDWRVLNIYIYIYTWFIHICGKLMCLYEGYVIKRISPLNHGRRNMVQYIHFRIMTFPGVKTTSLNQKSLEISGHDESDMFIWITIPFKMAALPYQSVHHTSTDQSGRYRACLKKWVGLDDFMMKPHGLFLESLAQNFMGNPWKSRNSRREVIWIMENHWKILPFTWG